MTTPQICLISLLVGTLTRHREYCDLCFVYLNTIPIFTVSQSHLQDRFDSLDHLCILLSVRRVPWKKMQLSEECAMCLQWLLGITLFPTDAPEQVMLESGMSASSAMHSHPAQPPKCSMFFSVWSRERPL